MKVKIKNNDYRTRVINGVTIKPFETAEVDIKSGTILHSKLQIIKEEKKVEKPIIFGDKLKKK